MSIAVLTGVLLLGGSFVFYMIPEPPDPGFQMAIFIMLLLIGGALFTSTIFSDYGDKRKAVPALTLPATAFEKFLVGWLYSYLIFLVVYIGVFYLAVYGLSSGRHWSGNQHFYVLNLHQNWTVELCVMYSLVHGLALFGAIHFRKLHFIKSGFVFFIGIGVVIVLNTLFLKVITGIKVVRAAIPFGFLDFNIDDRRYSVADYNSTVVSGILIILVTVTLLLWAAAYFKLKEKQV
jgi:hypothetical protein